MWILWGFVMDPIPLMFHEMKVMLCCVAGIDVIAQ